MKIAGALVSAMFLLLVIASCTLGPDYLPPCIETPEEWKAAHPIPENGSNVAYWWEVFEDESLNCLEAQAIANNPNLYTALESVVYARSIAGVREADLYPQITLNPSYSDTGLLMQFLAPASLLPANTVINNKAGFRIHQFQYTLPLNLSYEIDLWGKLRGRYKSAFRTAEAEQEAFYSTLLTLTADVAGSYYQMRSLDAQINLYNLTIENLQKQFAINSSRYDKGLVTYIDVADASLQLTNAQATREDLIRQRALQEDAIAALIGVSPAEFCLPPSPLTGIPPAIPAGVPASVLINRPDIAQAERNMAAQHALIGVAYASFFPSLELTGTLGFESPFLKEFLKWKSRYWMMGANIAQSIFDGGRNCANLQAAYASYRETEGSYRQQVITAFKEVEDALNNLEMQYKQSRYLVQSVQSSTTAYEMAQKRYLQGLTGFLEVMIAQTQHLEAERSFIILQGVRFLSTIQLIKALGGSWEC